MNRTSIHVAGSLLLALSLSTGACRSQAPKVNPQEITLPDGGLPGVGSINDALEGGRLITLVGANLSNKEILIFSVDGQGGSNIGPAWGAVRGGMTATIPKNLHKPFYVRVGWDNEGYFIRDDDPKWGPKILPASIYKSKLVKVRGLIPSNPRVLLVIFYPKDRVECEVLAEGTDEYDYVAALAKREVIA